MSLKRHWTRGKSLYKEINWAKHQVWEIIMRSVKYETVARQIKIWQAAPLYIVNGKQYRIKKSRSKLCCNSYFLGINLKRPLKDDNQSSEQLLRGKWKYNKWEYRMSVSKHKSMILRLEKHWWEVFLKRYRREEAFPLKDVQKPRRVFTFTDDTWLSLKLAHSIAINQHILLAVC